MFRGSFHNDKCFGTRSITKFLLTSVLKGSEVFGLIASTGTFEPIDRSQCPFCVLPIMRCAFTHQICENSTCARVEKNGDVCVVSGRYNENVFHDLWGLSQELVVRVGFFPEKKATHFGPLNKTLCIVTYPHGVQSPQRCAWQHHLFTHENFQDLAESMPAAQMQENTDMHKLQHASHHRSNVVV